MHPAPSTTATSFPRRRPVPLAARKAARKRLRMLRSITTTPIFALQVCPTVPAHWARDRRVPKQRRPNEKRSGVPSTYDGVHHRSGCRRSYSPSARTMTQPLTGDFAQISAGTKNWPSPKNDDDTAMDDLWHAAVNGGGTYYSAKNPQALSDGLGDALREVGSRGGSAAAASTSNPQVTTTDNFVFSANYRTAFWDSVIRRRAIDVITGALAETSIGKRASILNTMVSASADVRTIYTFMARGANKLKLFHWSNLTAAEKAHLDVNSWADPALKLSSGPGSRLSDRQPARAPDALVGVHPRTNWPGGRQRQRRHSISWPRKRAG